MSGTQRTQPGQPERVIDLGGFIKNQREIARMSVRRLAELAEVSNPYLSQIERGLRRPSAEILQQIARALQISAETLYVRAGLLGDEATVANEVRDAIVRDPLLSAEQQRALLNVYDSFVASGAQAAQPSDQTGQTPRPTRTNPTRTNPTDVTRSSRSHKSGMTT